ncbi:uncharacterized protein TNIN_69341 [Trichonephila inaurata madagascariensis]|uniref:RNase H type-1 domain-containing protein n=1 Tax=Trichonephila inaurata madagascariensis TaxID=2747483 RepID=A0A8X7CC87_9ARAC|nr:uncharacterized protein TNIN_69341 [Trichonephila inaurata madagascariensis]
MQWILSHCGIDGNKSVDCLAKKGTKSFKPLTIQFFNSTKRIMKNYYREYFFSEFSQKNNQKVWFSKLLHILKWPRDRAVAYFRIATGHDCLSKHLNRIGILQSPLCKLCDSNEEMDTINLACCRALSSGSMWSRYWEARHKKCNL